MATKQISIQLTGKFEDEKNPRLDSFLEQLGAIETILKELDYRFMEKQRASVYYRIVDLFHESPPTVVLEPVAFDPIVDHGDAVVERFGNHLRTFLSRKTPDDVDYELKKKYLKVLRNVDGNITRMRIKTDEHPIDITAEITQTLSMEGITDVEIIGTVSGKLDSIQLHNKREFRIYPLTGPSSIKCVFPESRRAEITAAIDKWVMVTGILRYVGGAKYPSEMIVQKLRAKKPPDELPRLTDLRGTGIVSGKSLSSEEIVRRIREDDW